MVFWLPLRQSRWLYCLRWLQHGCAALALWHIDWPNAVRFAVLLLIFLYAQRQTPIPQALLFDTHGLQVFYAGQRLRARLGAQCYCSEFLIVLNLHLEQDVPEEGVRSGAVLPARWLLLLPDASNQDALRRLRVYLRWHAQM